MLWEVVDQGNDSEAFRTLRQSALDGLNPRMAWWEWCAEWGADIDDQVLWLRVNPAVATGRVPMQAIADDRAVLPVDAFRAEFGERAALINHDGPHLRIEMIGNPARQPCHTERLSQWVPK
ncbi:MAG: hypothetical protein JOZ49_23845, partial [Mycolicibacterium sp.]|nr:hypothetical protein [Mycolicibacterium sp.]